MCVCVSVSVSVCVLPPQESPGGDDLGAAAAEVLPGVPGGEAGGPERQAGGAPGEAQPAGAEQQEPGPGAGDPAEGGETREVGWMGILQMAYNHLGRSAYGGG